MNENLEHTPVLSAQLTTLDEQPAAKLDELSIVELEERLEFFVWCGVGRDN